ncbi:MAG: diphosphate--fructose-6-phosphate 1-phosphotransferase [Nitrospinota bacterium]|nr:diphosphate--fructose-6-phosphate 1-phosphotransferase [Nitrospinota bacterium]
MEMNNLTAGILVGGGPAPGINGVIRAATIKLRNHGAKVFGIYDGFSHLMKGDISRVKELHIEDVSVIHFDGGSILRTSRANPTKKAEDLETVVEGLQKLGINCLITIGGDDTCYSAHKIAKQAEGRIQVIHVPKTIDNDINLPHGIRTFGFASARSFGVKIVKSVMNDAKSTGRWYFVIAMGRKAGHLALGIGSPAGATLTVIPEERREEKMDLNWLVDTLVGAIIKRISVGRDYGVAVLAEGLAEKLDEAQLAAMGQLEYDEHGHPRLSEIDFGRVVKTRVRQELAKLGIKMTIVDKDIGYELRCADPTSFEMEYVKELGFSAAKHALMGGSGDMVSIQDGVFVPIPFYAIMDPSTGRTKVRMMDIHSEAYEMALEYMIRLKKEDFENEETVKKLAACANLDPEQFRQRFEKVAVKFEGSSVVIPYQQPKA